MIGLSAVDLDTAQNASLFTVAGAVLVALLCVWVVKQVVTKILSVVVLLAIAGLVWTQRAELVDCADQVKATIDTQLATDTTCTFFGQDVTIPGRNRIDPTATTDPAGTTTTSTTAP